MSNAERIATDLLELAKNYGDARKLRWFASALVRQPTIWNELGSSTIREIVEIGELLADGKCPRPDLLSAQKRAQTAQRSANRGELRKREVARLLASLTVVDDASLLAMWSQLLRRPVSRDLLDIPYPIFVEIFGDPDRPVTLDETLLGWNNGIIESMAGQIYEEQAFEQMPILADALEDAGCSESAVLDHCREDGNHVRGCWVLDLLMGRG